MCFTEIYITNTFVNRILKYISVLFCNKFVIFRKNSIRMLKKSKFSSNCEIRVMSDYIPIEERFHGLTK